MTTLSTHEKAPIVRSQPQGWRPEQVVDKVRRNDLRMLTPKRKPNVARNRPAEGRSG